MARLLLGVSGGIAAYKALETARLAVKAGHAVRVIQTPTSERFVGRASFEAITGAPVLVERVRARSRRAAPIPASRCPSAPRSATWRWSSAPTLYLIAPASANTIAKLAHGHADNLLTTAALAARLPGRGGAGDEQPDVPHPATQANLELLARPRRDGASRPGRASWRSHGEHGVGRLAEPDELLGRVRGAADGRRRWSGVERAGHRRRHARADRQRPLHRQPLLGADGLRARRARRPPGRRGDVVAANVALDAAGRRPGGRRRHRRRAGAACEREFDALRRAADGRRGRRLPARRAPVEHKLKKDQGTPQRSSSSRPRTCSARWPAPARPGQVLVGFAAEHGDGAVEYGRGKLERKRLDAVVVNDISTPGHRLRLRRQRGDDRDGRRARAAGAAGEQGTASRERSWTRSSDLRSREGRKRMEPEQTPVAPQESEAVAALARRLAANIARAVQVRAETLDHLIVALLAEGHVLVEDYPGVGKTALARALARSIDCQFARIQCTSDLLPADVVGTNVYDQREQRFEFRPGPVFANVVLVDEINRASPKTQSGLLECMQERRVTVDVHTHELARPFLVLATQNPIEYEGTYPLPEAQVDRFMIRISLGYPSRSRRGGMLADHEAGDRVLSLAPVATAAEVLAAQDAAERVRASEPLRDYIVRAAVAHARGSPGRPRREPAGRPDAAARRQGARDDAGPRPRAARRRAGAGRAGARAPAGARAGVAARRAAGRGRATRSRRCGRCDVRPGRRRWPAAGLAACSCSALLFDAAPLFVPGRRVRADRRSARPPGSGSPPRGARVDRAAPRRPGGRGRAAGGDDRGHAAAPGAARAASCAIRSPATPVSLRGWLSPIRRRPARQRRVVARFAAPRARQRRAAVAGRSRPARARARRCAAAAGPARRGAGAAAHRARQWLARERRAP